MTPFHWAWMRRLFAATALLLASLGAGIAPASAAPQCKASTCVTAVAIPKGNTWEARIDLAARSTDYDWFNVRAVGYPQMEVEGRSATITLQMPANWDGNFSVQACIGSLTGSNCDTWSVFTAELQLGADERNFCIRYGGHAASTSASAQQQGCRFDYGSGRFSTNRDEHQNWCLGEMRKVAGNQNRIAEVRNWANSEEAERVKGLQSCQASVAALNQQRQEEMRVTGKSPEQCVQSNLQCEQRNKAQLGPINSVGVIAAQCTPFFQQCMANAAASAAAFKQQREDEVRVTGKTQEQCIQSNLQCEARTRAQVTPIQAPAVIAGMCTPFFQQCMQNAALAAAEAAGGNAGGGAPAPQPEQAQPGGTQMASTCGLPVGTATVVIPDPSITVLNVRDKPAGQILSQIPEGSQVTVAGGCGVRIAAGIVAGGTGSGGGQAGWCAIESPMVGCVSERFLVAGMVSAEMQGGMGGAGLTANKPRPETQQPQMQQQGGVQIQPPLPEMGQVAQGAGMSATFIRGANIRNGPSSKNTRVLGSLPAGSVVNVIGCKGGWCQLALPEFQVAWTGQQFLQMNGPAMQPQMQGDMGGGMAGGDMGGGGMAPPAPPMEMQQQGGGQQMASTCALGAGTATVTIPDPNITTLNVRDKPGGTVLTQIPEFSQVTIVGGCSSKIAAGIVAGGIGGGSGPPGWCAISAPTIGCVADRFLTAGVVAEGQGGGFEGGAGLVANKPQATASFTGNWSAEAQGVGYTFVMNQNGNSVSGSYSGGDGSQGQISGNVQGNVLRFRWQQADGLSGMGRFALTQDGNAFRGSYTLGNNPDEAEGSWNGSRQ